MNIYYDSKTGNVERFINKVKKIKPEWTFIKIDPFMEIKEKGHLVTFTTNVGQLPLVTSEFLENSENKNYIETVSSSGNMNWGAFFGVAANIINEKYKIPILMKFELSGTNIQVEYFIDYIEENI